jgi:hypothetical protein
MRGAVNQTKDGLALNIKGKTVKVKTVVLQDVAINGKLRGIVTEATEKVIKPKREVSQWNRLQYVCSIGKYVDVRTKEPVTEAQAAYLVGKDIYYLPVQS